MEVLRADDLPEGGVDPDSVRRLVRHPRARLVALTWIPTNGGLIQPAAEVGAIARGGRAAVLVDACQASGNCRSTSHAVGATSWLALRASSCAVRAGSGSSRCPTGCSRTAAIRWASTCAAPTSVRAGRSSSRRRTAVRELGVLVRARARAGAAARYALDVGIDGAHRSERSRLARRVRGDSRFPLPDRIEPGRRLSAIVTVAFAGGRTRSARRRPSVRAASTRVRRRAARAVQADGAPGTSMLRISPHYLQHRGRDRQGHVDPRGDRVERPDRGPGPPRTGSPDRPTARPPDRPTARRDGGCTRSVRPQRPAVRPDVWRGRGTPALDPRRAVRCCRPWTLAPVHRR